MPTIEFNGKWNIYAAHLTTPFRPLEINKKRSVAPRKNADGNLIVHGDNLHALKSLLPYYGGRVNCVYIDPPYNTGNEGWCYNDNLNAPLMKRWLRDNGEVDREDEERHDKWLCMMWPRLNLLRDLLAENGVIFVSIDDNEVHRLRMIMDEIFGADNFVSNMVWEKVKIRKNSAQYFSQSHEHILVYAKSKMLWSRQLSPRSDTSNYKNPDNDKRGVWIAVPIHANHKYDANYKITKPNGVVLSRPKNNYWRLSEESFKKYVKDGRIWWGKGDSYPMIKKFLSEVQDGLVPKTIFYYDETGGGPRGDKVLKDIFNGEKVFENPKSVDLIKKIIRIANGKQGIILDSFAGSGTTAQAVMELNKEDGGNRQFILVECEKYADTITAERVRRVIKKLHLENGQSLVKNSFNDNFTFCTLGKEIGIDTMLSRKKLPDYETVARCAALNLTGAMLDKVKRGKDWFFGETENYRLHLIYEPEASFLKSAESAFTLEIAKRIGKAAAAQRKTALVFATQQFVSQKELNRYHVIFCKLPYYVVNSFG